MFMSELEHPAGFFKLDYLMDKRGVCHFFGISAAELKRGIKQGRLPKPKVEGLWVRSECQQVIDGRGLQ
jgi:hypothetical protein